MIYGIGTDLVEIARLERAYQRHGERLLSRILAPAERTGFITAPEPARFLAKRWAVKEAFAKATGLGVRPPLALSSVWLEHDALGRPELRFDEPLTAWLAQRGIGRASVSVSDERTMALAFVVLERLD
ncbi:holo-ACP synthase [Chitinimonas lacunae]|uniref:Holo-[acyl-carrier-protein] synthase n=1 Tax=Chitinimonas lacunae TaxID=1963018 RepID=A0ABV8MPY9_9NEIS